MKLEPASATARWRGLDPRLACGALGLAGLLALAAFIAIDAAASTSYLVPAGKLRYPDWLRGPFAGIAHHRLGLGSFPWFLLATFACYLAVLASADRVPPRVAIAALAALHLVFLLAPPLLSADIFGYLDWARMGALHHLDPYTHASGSLAGDAVHPFVRWHRFASPYGPLFTLASYGLAPLGVPAALWTTKAVMAGAAGGCLALVWRLAERVGRRPVPAALFVGANPLWLVYAVGGGHNDLLMMLFVLAGVGALLAGREAPGAASLVAAVAIKASAGIVAPFALVGARRPRSVLVGAAVAAGAVALLTFVVFGQHGFRFVDVLRTQQNLVAFHSVPNQVGRLLGVGGATPELRRTAQIVLAIAVVALLWHVRRGGRWLDAAGWATLALLITSAWLLAWYAVWLLPLAALSSPSSRLRAGAILFTLYVVVIQFPAVSG